MQVWVSAHGEAILIDIVNVIAELTVKTFLLTLAISLM